MTTVLAFVFVLGVLVFVHELGHFLAARRIGVRVLTFSLGFGPKLLSFRRGDTEYCVSAIPLGGYVKMAGENPDDSRTGAADEFLSKTKWQRFQVLIMGPVMNLALALVVMTLVLYQGAHLPAHEKQPVVVGSLTDDSVAAAAGVLPGDRIVRIDDRPVDTWEQFLMTIVTKANRQVSVVIDRNGKYVTLSMTPNAVGRFEMGDIGVLPIMRPEIIAVNSGPAQEAGLKAGDIIVGVDGVRGLSQTEVIDRIKASGGKPMIFDVLRAGREMSITITPRLTGETMMIGAQISPWELRVVEPGIIEAFNLSVQRNWEWTRLIVETLGGLFTREVSVKQLMGPVAIADLSGSAAEQGWVELFGLMAMISLNLGLLNLMPIPVLDGGHIAILALEGLSRRDFSMKVKEKMLLAGFVLLVMLMVTVIYNDLARVQWLGRLMPWR
ncbi:MAG TPA: RIP metalloprotease RseP [Vicinamibacterales bacterium]|nr:RIP metalloprotease RseP [Vicinamibacterales bacterium]